MIAEIQKTQRLLDGQQGAEDSQRPEVEPGSGTLFFFFFKSQTTS